MDKFIELFLKATKLLHKIGILFIFLLIVVFIDYFTSWPSLSFTKDKYEAIEVLSKVSNDTSLSLDIRTQASNEIIDLSERKSIRNYLLLFWESVKNTASMKVHINPPITLSPNATTIDIIKYVIKYMWYLYCCLGLFLGLFRMFNKFAKGNILAHGVLYSVATLSFILSLIASTNYPQYPFIAAFLTQLSFISAITIVLLIVNRIQTKYI